MIKDKKDENKNKKKALLVLGIAATVAIAGTYALFQTSDLFENEFSAAKYSPKIVEKFQSPSDWTPGTTTAKTVEVTNEGTVPMAVRVKYTEKWTNTEGTNLPLVLNGTEERVSIVNLNDDNTWKKVGDYYYYVGEVAPGAKTTSFIESVTFNRNVALNSTSRNVVDTDTDGDGINDTKTVTYTINEYNEATYDLDINVETIQADQAESEWGVDVTNLGA